MLRIVIASLCLVAPISAQQNSGAPTNCVLNEKRPNPGNQFTYYQCGAEGPVLKKCSDNMVFDSAAMDCVKQIAQNQAMNNVSVAKVPTGWSPPPPAGWSSGPPPAGWSGGPPPAGWSGGPPPSGWSGGSPPAGWTTTPPPGTDPTPPGWTPGGWGSVPYTTTTVKPIEPVGVCPEQDPHGWGWSSWAYYYPDAESCYVFYECSNGVAYQFSCPFPTYWDALVETCNYGYPGYYIYCGENRKRNLEIIMKSKKNKNKGKDKNEVKPQPLV